MTSAINTSTINVSYPTPGINNSSQGFRDNFTGIKNNFETTASEITELQARSILKQALPNTVLDNDMSNNLIKRAQTLSFVASTYNLGSNLSGTINIDISLGDVHYGSLTGNALLAFSKWGPDKTQSSVEVVLSVTPGIVITLSPNVTLALATIENLVGSTITVPNNVTRLHFKFTSLDCGTSVEITSLDRPRQATQLAVSTVPTSSTSTGLAGQIAYDSNYIYLCIAANIWKRVAYSASVW